MANNQLVTASSQRESIPVNFLQKSESGAAGKMNSCGWLVESSSSSEETLSKSDLNGSRSRSRSAPTAGEASVKKPKAASLFKRIWSLDDEVVLLKGLAKFLNGRLYQKAVDLNNFYTFIKKDLHLSYTIAQVKNKITSLQSKYGRNSKKEKGRKTNEHSKITFELSRALWEDKASTSKRGRPRGSGTKRNGPEVETELRIEPWDAYQAGVLKAWAESNGRGKDWKKLKVEDMEKHCNELEKHYNELEDKIVESRFVLSVLKAKKGATSPNQV